MDGIDPEVAADIALRDATRRERMPMSTRVYAWTKPVIVEHWPCQRCKTAMVEVTEEALHAFDVHNRELVRRGEEPLNKAKIMWCAPCAQKRDEYGEQLFWKRQDALNVAIRRLEELAEEPGTPAVAAEEREPIERCRLMHHPDVAGLTQALKDRRERAGNAKTGKRRL